MKIIFIQHKKLNMMTSPKFVLYLTCFVLGKMAQTTLPSSLHQESDFVLVKTGDNLTLQCFYERHIPVRLYWYKKSLGQKPRLISTFYMLDKNGTFHGEFKNNPRFTLASENGNNHLTITDLRISDSATYNCISCFLYRLNISESTTVSVKASGVSIPTLVHQSASETIQPGDSVTLNCTVHTGTCDEEHSVYWFKNSEESHPGLIYTHGGRNDQCERNPNTQTHTCVYNLPMKSLNLSHAGTYYCAVASCGHILFGNGTELDFEDKVDFLVLVYFLISALTFSTILLVLLTLSVYKNKRNRFQSPECQARFSAPSTANVEEHRDVDNLHYVALNVKPPKGSRRQRKNTNSECVYASVKN